MGALAAEVKTSGRFATLAANVGPGLLDFLYPPVCLACSAPVGEANGLCADCWQALKPITAPLCAKTGLPFAVDMGENAVSAEALNAPPEYDRARAAFVYSELSARLVARFKYGDRPELAAFISLAMAGAGRELWPGDPVLVPVPLHRLRLWRRGYNQSAELARDLGRRLGLDYAPDLAVRRRHTRQQVGLSGEQRRRNVAGAFAIDRHVAARLAGRRLVLVDDVVTTGATVSALTRALRRAGFDHIDVISFARVVPGAEMPI